VVVLQVDEDLLQKQQEAYRVQGVDEDEKANAQQFKKKRKQGEEVSILSIHVRGKKLRWANR
jgi:hypothetical protein